MKYADGLWLNKPGYGVNYATQMYEVTADETSINVLATNQWIGNRGMTLGGPVLEITFTSTLENTIKVSIDHYKGRVHKTPDFQLNEDKNFKPVIKETEDAFELISGSTKVVVAKGGAWDIKYYYNDKLLTKEGWRTTSYITEDQWKTNERMANDQMKPFFSHDETADGAVMREMLNISVGENLYGFGEKFSTFVKNGQTVEVWNNDGGTSSEQSYKSIPFYVSSRNYGVFVNHPEKVTFEVASETVSKVAFSVQGEHLEYFVIGGEKLTDVVSTYTTLTGKPALTPAYTFGLWLTTSFTTNYDEATVSSFIDGMAERDIPLEVFHFDCFWMKEFNWCDLTWDKRMFPDPKAMLDRLKAKGLEICVWINSYIAQRSSMFDEGVKGGYFLKTKDGSVWQGDMWQPGMAIVDFTNPGGKKWYQKKLEALVDMGVDCFKTDFGERIPTDCVYYDKKNPEKMHNYYTYLYNEAVFEVLEKKKGKDEAVLFARSATAGGQKFPVHWGGDCWSDYESMEESLRGGLSLQLSGFGFWSHDIGGFENTSTADVYKRWCAFGLLSSHSRLHGSTSYRVPWAYDDEAVDVLRSFVRLKARLMPYLWKTALTAHNEGIPSMRAMVLSYTNDKMCNYLDKQYMLGDSLLVAPIFNDEGIGEYYLPKENGIWTDFFTGRQQEGGDWYTRTYAYTEIPLMVRPNTVLPLGNSEEGPEYDYADQVTFRVYDVQDEAAAEIYDMDQNKVASIVVKRIEDKLVIDCDSKKPFTVELVNTGILDVKGAKASKENKNTILRDCESHIECIQ